MRKLLVCLSLTITVLGCDASSPSSLASDGSGPHPMPSDFGSLTIRPDTGAFVVGRHLRFLVTAVDASGVPTDASNTEVSSSNPAIARFSESMLIPVTNPPAPHINALSATFDLMSAGSTAIHARLGIFSDSLVITVVPPN
jgi:hypothetical protein